MTNKEAVSIPFILFFRVAGIPVPVQEGVLGCMRLGMPGVGQWATAGEGPQCFREELWGTVVPDAAGLCMESWVVSPACLFPGA
jgi:hypothetical protein